MRRKRLSKPEQLQMIRNCRASGLSDYQWCQQQGIRSSTFYNWITRLRKAGYTFPESQAKIEALPVKQEVVKLEVLPKETGASQLAEHQNTCNSNPIITESSNAVAVEVEIAGATVRFFNNTNPELLKYTLECMGGTAHAW